jgi:glycosyltransferase involved in cell wall biosynthesis
MTALRQRRLRVRRAGASGRIVAFAPDEPLPAATDAPRVALGACFPPATAATPAAQPEPIETGDPAARTSVLVNTWNQAAYIEDCIDSLLVQTVLPDEIIVYDDGSSDDTVRRLRRYGARLTLIEGVRTGQPNHVAQAAAINAAFRRCTGRLIFLLDGDDRFKRDKIETYLAIYRANPDCALIQSPMDKIDQHGRVIGSNVEPRKHVVDHLRHIYRQQDVDLFYPTSALAFSRALLQAVLPLDFSDGFALWADTRLSIIAPHFGRVITLPQAYTEWRRHFRSDSIQIRCRKHQLRQTLMRTQVFNRFCRTHGLPTISAWRNWRFYLQLLRFTLPDRAYRVFYERVRPRLNRAY